MLKQRVMTAAILGGGLLWAVFAGSKPQLAAVLVLVTLLSFWEWSRLCGLRSLAHRLPYTVIGGGFASLAVSPMAAQLPATPLASLGFLAWCAITLCLLRDKPPPALRNRIDPWRMVLAPPLFAITLWGLVWLRESEWGSPLLLIYVFSIVWLADIGAFFVGRRWGNTKLAPTLSPGKTREGALGGLVAVCLLALMATWLAPFALPPGVLIVATISAGVVSIYGDLFESAMKRSAGVKDSGALLPGHGGVLDRIDSVIAAVPVFVFIVLMGS